MQIGRLFGSRAFALGKLEKYDQLGINTKHVLAGGFAGICYTNVAFVFDLLKVRAQNNMTQSIHYREEIGRIYRTEGLNGFLRGYQGMLLRDFPGFAYYFFTYELLKRWSSGLDTSTRERTIFKQVCQFLSGGVAGATTWVMCYPADFLKTRL